MRGRVPPTARTLARDATTREVDPIEAGRAAEMGLFWSGLRRRPPEGREFEAFDRASNQSQFHRITVIRRRHRIRGPGTGFVR